ncbi:hypothetical protein N9N67_07600 [Bacteriovoracaceae bacterium]|nr:hypothetical protein [Bacteriovoracaceae bacterium]
MKFLLTVLLSLSFINTYADDYLYFDYNTFSDDGGETIHRFFKVKIPVMKENEAMMCSIMFDYINEGKKEEGDSAYLIIVERKEKQSILGINYENEDMEMSEPTYTTSMDIRKDFNQLFVSSSHGDGYVSDELMAGSKSLIMASIKYFQNEDNDADSHKYPDGKIDQAFDLTGQKYSKVIEGEDDPNYKTMMNVECEMDQEER